MGGWLDDSWVDTKNKDELGGVLVPGQLPPVDSIKKWFL